MAGPLLTAAITAVTILTLSFPVAGEDGHAERTPWKKADPASDTVIRWVVEGCAAYPVTADAEAKASSSDAGDLEEAQISAGLETPAVER